MREPRFTLENRTGYDSADLARFTRAAMIGEGVPGPVAFLFVAAPARSRGCAEIGSPRRHGRKMVVAVAAPNRFRLLRLANLFRHELAHIKGQDHDAMLACASCGEGGKRLDVQWSLGPLPAWARPFVARPIRYHGPAPRQFPPDLARGSRPARRDSSIRGYTVVKDGDAGYGEIFPTTRR